MIINTTKKDYFWSYTSYILKFGVNLFIFPMVLNMLNQSEYGLWVTFASIATIINLFDFGFSSTILRNLTYVWGGAQSLQRDGCQNITGCDDRNDRLFVLSYLTCRRIYSIIALISLIVSSTFGVLYIIYITREFFCMEYIIAWLIYSINIGVNLYYAYCTVSLKSVGAIESSQKATILGYLVQIILSYVGLLVGGGLIALAIAGCLCGFVTRIVSQYFFYRYKDIGLILKKYSGTISSLEVSEAFKVFWYNAKKAGISSIATVAMTQGTTLLCSAFLGVGVTGEYGVCLQLLNSLSGVSQIHYQTSIPQLTQSRLNNDKDKVLTLFSSSIFFAWILFILGSITIIIFGQPLLTLIKSKTELNIYIFILLMVIVFGEMNYSIHASFISLENKLPFVKSVVVTSVFLLILSCGSIIIYQSIWVLLSIRCIVEGAYMFWKWPLFAHEQLEANTFLILQNGLNYWINTIKKLQLKKRRCKE